MPSSKDKSSDTKMRKLRPSKGKGHVHSHIRTWRLSWDLDPVQDGQPLLLATWAVAEGAGRWGPNRTAVPGGMGDQPRPLTSQRVPGTGDHLRGGPTHTRVQTTLLQEPGSLGVGHSLLEV